MNYWLHSDLVYVEGKRSPGWREYHYLADLFSQGYTGREVRFLDAVHSLPETTSFFLQALETARKTLKRLDEFVQKLYSSNRGKKNIRRSGSSLSLQEPIRRAMDDDLNIAAALSALFKLVRALNPVFIEKTDYPEEFGKSIWS